MDEQSQQRWLAQMAEHAVVPDLPLYGYHVVDPGWRIDFNRGLTEHLTYLVITGSCEGHIDGESVRAEPGTAIWIKPGVAFALRLAGSTLMTLYRFRLAALGPADEILRPALILHDAWELRPTFDALIAEIGAHLPFREQRLRALLVLLFSSMFRLAQPSDGGGSRFDSRQRQSLEEYVDMRISERPSAEELARQAGLSVDYFARRFRRTFGMAPKSWLVRRRIQHAATRLDESTDSISEIAADLGYPDVFLFSRQFKAVMGMSPRAYRSR